MIPISTFYRFSSLSEEVRNTNKIKGKDRRDCTGFCSEQNHDPLKWFRNHKGQLYINLARSHLVVHADNKRKADYVLQSKSINLTSIFFEDQDNPLYGYGYPNEKPRLNNGKPNPLYPFSEDGYLFRVNGFDYSLIELFIIRHAKRRIRDFYYWMIDGMYNDQIDQMRCEVMPLFDYWTYSTSSV